MKSREIFRIIISLLGGLAAFALTMFFRMPLPMIILIPVAVYAGVYLVSKPVIKIGSLKLSDVKGEEMKSLMKDAYEDLDILDKTGKKIQDPTVRKLALELYQSGISIFEHLQENPDKIGLARRFINYYLDTAAGLLEKYQKLISSRVRGESVEKAKADIVSGLTVLTRAFDQQYERLMQGEIMDITTDVKVLEQTLRSEE
ncbi:MAG: 5-bromo-4-chloroindolyl phosphate hydrolysis family protein [Lachnospiraceae bacterium]|jgi:5-bromo-4-chloroindolyl phosphate hydrolysis protein